jgi:hypothetical protein
VSRVETEFIHVKPRVLSQPTAPLIFAVVVSQVLWSLNFVTCKLGNRSQELVGECLWFKEV